MFLAQVNSYIVMVVDYFILRYYDSVHCWSWFNTGRELIQKVFCINESTDTYKRDALSSTVPCDG